MRRAPLKSIPCVIWEVFSFPPLLLLLFPVTGALWKRSKRVIWNASVWSLWSRLFAEPRFIICDVSPVLCGLHKELLSSDRPCVLADENVKLCHLHNYRQRARNKKALKSLLNDWPLFPALTNKLGYGAFPTILQKIMYLSNIIFISTIIIIISTSSRE